MARRASAEKATEMRVETVTLADLKPHPRNYRQHPEDQLSHLVRSIEEHGFYRAIIAARDLTILAGHGLALAARRMGLTEVPVLRLDLDPEDPRALKVLVADNELSHLSEVNDRTLTEILKDVYASSQDGLLGTGFDEKSLNALIFVTRPPDQIRGKDDDASHWVGLPEYAPASPHPRIVLTFLTEEDRVRCMEVLGLKNSDRNKVTGQTWSLWWPARKDIEPLHRDGQVEG